MSYDLVTHPPGTFGSRVRSASNNGKADGLELASSVVSFICYPTSSTFPHLLTSNHNECSTRRNMEVLVCFFQRNGTFTSHLCEILTSCHFREIEEEASASQSVSPSTSVRADNIEAKFVTPPILNRKLLKQSIHNDCRHLKQLQAEFRKPLPEMLR